MSRWLRNIGVRLWLTLLVSVPGCFFLLPWVSPLRAGPGQVGFFIGVTGVCYAVISVLMHLAGVWMIQKRIHEAKVWEQAGIAARAERKYRQAVRIYDSILPSPVRSGKLRLLMTRSLARFALTFDRHFDNVGQAVQVYLSSTPHDDVLAALWLEQLAAGRQMTAGDQALLTRLAQVHYTTSGLLPLLARIFLDTGRMDFIARQVYAQILADPESGKQFQQEIQDLTAVPLRKKTVFPGEPVPETLRNAVRSENRIRASLPVPGVLKQIRLTGQTLHSRMARAGSALVSFLKQGSSGTRPQTRQRFYLKAGIMGGVCVGALLFVLYSVFYVDAPEPVEKTKTVIEERVPKPFTIQVAAYLTRTHARQYLTALTQKGMDARIKTTTGGGKTWYLIQVSEFRDRQTAAAYGNHLISENMIEEFFVSNKD